GYRDPFPFTSPVGSFRPNPLGIYDLAGNVWEWCQEARERNSEERVLRGGSWRDGDETRLSATIRRPEPPAKRRSDIGFRCVLEG
ncbi:MAG: SUMF1/EgtB/PvdO family nonheme iron enzyme, partial [Verrucomicrobiota bacterium]